MPGSGAPPTRQPPTDRDRRAARWTLALIWVFAGVGASLLVSVASPRRHVSFVYREEVIIALDTIGTVAFAMLFRWGFGPGILKRPRI